MECDLMETDIWGCDQAPSHSEELPPLAHIPHLRTRSCQNALCECSSKKSSRRRR
uniref:Family with sequence similarity 98 member A n=1 Tax=Homo sapiens TaxID=9606 RepID=A0A8I5QKV4_HUMAN